MYGKKNTLQTAQLFAEEITDENLKNRFGTSVNEYMGREHSKVIREKINSLRNEFTQIGKSKTDKMEIYIYNNYFIYSFSQTNFKLTQNICLIFL